MCNERYQYSLRMSAPIGTRYGALELNILGDTGDGFLTMFSRRLPISQLRCSAGHLTFSGTMQTLLYPLPYTADGTMDDSSVRVVFDTGKGRFPAEGTAISVRREETQDL